MNKKVKLVVSILAIIVVALVLFFVTHAITKNTGYVVRDDRLDNFAGCIASKGNAVYIESDCPICQTQKELFGSAWDRLNVTSCDSEENSEEAGCIGIRISQEPTWYLNGRYRSGFKNLETLSGITNCSL